MAQSPMPQAREACPQLRNLGGGAAHCRLTRAQHPGWIKLHKFATGRGNVPVVELSAARLADWGRLACQAGRQAAGLQYGRAPAP